LRLDCLLPPPEKTFFRVGVPCSPSRLTRTHVKVVIWHEGDLSSYIGSNLDTVFIMMRRWHAACLIVINDV
jgi:hypothetical protein